MTDATTPASTGQTLGYARVSTTAQHLDRQLDALTAAGVPRDRIYVDKRTGAHTQREGLTGLLDYARPGDVILVYTLDRLGRSLRDTLNMVHTLRERGIGLCTLADAIPINTDDESPTGTLALSLLALFAELERIYARERVAHARSVAETKGKSAGRPRKLDDEKIRYAQYLRGVEGLPIAEIATRLGVSEATLYRRLPPREVAAPTASGVTPLR